MRRYGFTRFEKQKKSSSSQEKNCPFIFAPKNSQNDPLKKSHHPHTSLSLSSQFNLRLKSSVVKKIEPTSSKIHMDLIDKKWEFKIKKSKRARWADHSRPSRDN